MLKGLGYEAGDKDDGWLQAGGSSSRDSRYDTRAVNDAVVGSASGCLLRLRSAVLNGIPPEAVILTFRSRAVNRAGAALKLRFTKIKHAEKVISAGKEDLVDQTSALNKNNYSFPSKARAGKDGNSASDWMWYDETSASDSRLGQGEPHRTHQAHYGVLRVDSVLGQTSSDDKCLKVLRILPLLGTLHSASCHRSLPGTEGSFIDMVPISLFGKLFWPISMTWLSNLRTATVKGSKGQAEYSWERPAGREVEQPFALGAGTRCVQGA